MSDSNEQCICCGESAEEYIETDNGVIGPFCKPCCDLCLAECWPKASRHIDNVVPWIAGIIKERDEYDLRRRAAMEMVEEWRQKCWKLEAALSEAHGKIDAPTEVTYGTILTMKASSTVQVDWAIVVDKVQCLPNGDWLISVIEKKGY